MRTARVAVKKMGIVEAMLTNTVADTAVSHDIAPASSDE